MEANVSSSKQLHANLSGKTALVTGGAKGIGKAIAFGFARAGADVTICDLKSMMEPLENVAEEIRSLGRKSLAVAADTSQKKDVDQMVSKAAEQFGAIDILVNNAGILIRSSLLNMSENDWDKLMGVDLKGYYLCSQAVGQIMMKQKKGCIINISTQQAFKAFMPDFGPYGVAKAGVLMMTRYLAVELGPYGVRVNGVAPGITKTDFSKPTWSNAEVIKHVEEALPLKRMGEPAEIANAVLFLASDNSSYITGHTITVDGGSLA